MARIVLIGMPGAGKTTVGKALGRLLGLPFKDADRELATHTGVSVATIFEIEGEAGFRRRESALIAELLQSDNIIVATGGGAILSDQNRERMRNTAVVVYLRATLDALVERTQKDSSRPLLAGGNHREKLAALLSQREALYREIAHMTFETGRQSPTRLAAAIASALQAQHRKLLDTSGS